MEDKFLSRQCQDIQKGFSPGVLRWVPTGLGFRDQGRECTSLVFAYQSTLNRGAPIGCVHSILGVTDQVSPYEAITKGFQFRKKLCSEYFFGIENPLLWRHMEILDQ